MRKNMSRDVISSSDTFEQHQNTETQFKLSKFVSLITMGVGKVCLSHSVVQQQIFGDERLSTVFEFFRQPRNKSSFVERFSRVYSSEKVDELWKSLIKNYFITGNTDENIFCYTKSETEQRNHGYQLLRILLTDVCNMKCAYCKVMPNITEVTKHSTSNENLGHVVRLFFAGSEAKRPKIIHISGGEPLIAWDKIVYIVNLVKRYKRPEESYFIAIGTNGVLLTEEMVRFLADHNIKVIVSMDGSENVHDILRRNHAGHGTFKWVAAKVRLLKRYDIELGLSMVIGKHNVGRIIPEIDYLIAEFQPTSLGVNYMKPPIKNQIDFPYLVTPQEYVDAIYEAFRTFRHTGVFFELVYRKIYPFVTRRFRYHDCGATAGTTINIDAKGNIGPCKSFLVLNMVAQGLQRSGNNDKSVSTAYRFSIYSNNAHQCTLKNANIVRR